MKTTIDKIYILLLLLIITNVTFSQNYIKTPQEVETELKTDLNYLFQDLDKSKITSGLLSNYALELTELAPYDGVLSDTPVKRQMGLSRLALTPVNVIKDSRFFNDKQDKHLKYRISNN